MDDWMTVGKGIDGTMKPNAAFDVGRKLTLESSLDEIAQESADDEIGVGMRDLEVGEVIQSGFTVEGRDIPD